MGYEERSNLLARVAKLEKAVETLKEALVVQASELHRARDEKGGE